MSAPHQETESSWNKAATMMVICVPLVVCVLVGRLGFTLHLLDGTTSAPAMGLWLALIYGATLASVLATSVLILLCARGRSVPSFVIVGVAVVPWLLGLLGYFIDLEDRGTAIRATGSVERADALATAIAHATQLHSVGATVSSALLSMTALGLACSAVARRRGGPRALNLALGACVGLPLACIAGHAIRSIGVLDALGLAFAGTSALAATTLAGLAIGVDSPRGRGGALAAASATAAGLAVCAGVASIWTVGLGEALHAVSTAAATDRVELVRTAVSELAAVNAAGDAAIRVGATVAVTFAVWAALRARPNPRHAFGALALVLVGVFTVHVDRAVTEHCVEGLEPSEPDLWSLTTGFEPARFQSTSGVRPPDALVTMRGLARLDGSLLATFEPLALSVELERLATRSDLSPWLPALGGSHGRRQVVLAIDRRLRGAELRTLFDGLRQASIVHLTITGVPPNAADAGDLDRVRRSVPALASFLPSARTLSVWVAPEGWKLNSNDDPRLLHATVEAHVPRRLLARRGQPPGTSLKVRTSHCVAGGRERARSHAAYLLLGEDATAGSLISTAARIECGGGRAVIVHERFPGSPSQAHTSSSLRVGRARRRRRPRDECPGPPPRRREVRQTQVQLGRDVVVTGDYAPETVRRVIRRNFAAVRYCFMQGLQQQPSLQGRVVMGGRLDDEGMLGATHVVRSTLRNDQIETCLVSQMNRWRFPAPDRGPVDIELELILEDGS